VTGFTVGPDEVGTRLDVALAAQLGWSRSQAAARVADRLVRVDGEVVAKQHRLREGQRVEVEAAPDAPRSAPPALPPVRYRDEHLLVVAKPAGMVVHPGHGRPDGTLVDALSGAGVPLAPAGGEARPGIVHRLDRDTSGLVVVACTDEAHAALVAALKRRVVTRRYVALVEGVPANPRGRIEAPIGRDPRDRLRFAVVTDGKPAVTRYVTSGSGVVEDDVGRRREVAVLACTLGTGRTHQIRVHLSTLGHPVVGDPTYRGSRWVAEALGLHRTALHAGHLAFDHPITGARIEISEPLPADLAAAVAALGLGPDVGRVGADDEHGPGSPELGPPT
jgi:23S rRNA pseudouridine1911/1915/1917 synthase